MIKREMKKHSYAHTILGRGTQFNSYVAILRFLAQIKSKNNKKVLTDYRTPIWLYV